MKYKYDEWLNLHPMGICMYDKANERAFINIPKNASSSLKKILTNNNWVESRIHKLPNTVKYFAILRDPVDRFISATNMYFSLLPHCFETKVKTVKSNTKIRNNILETNDSHYEKQYHFLMDLDVNNIDLFYFKSDVVNNVCEYLNVPFEKHNEMFSDKIITNVNEEIIRNTYKEDYELINKVKYLNYAKESKHRL